MNDAHKEAERLDRIELRTRRGCTVIAIVLVVAALAFIFRMIRRIWVQ